MSTIRLTTAQALVRYVAALRAQTPAGVAPLLGGVFAIFGHGNVAGMGEALYAHRAEGTSKKVAGQLAAQMVLEKLNELAGAGGVEPTGE